MSSSSEKNSGMTIVVGDGWAALGAVGFLAAAGKDVTWIAGTAARVVPPLPAMEAGVGAAVLRELAMRLGVECGEIQTGSFLREFRNKAFREPAWVKAPTPAMRRDVRDEVLWAPERRIAGAFEARFGADLWELEEAVRARVAEMPKVQRIEGNPVAVVKPEVVVLGSGRELPYGRVIFADKVTRVGAVEGFPKSLAAVRRSEPMGALQALFTHEPRVGVGLLEGFSCLMHKEAGEEFERHVWGYFSRDGKQSVWTVFLTQEEVEDNHEIGKKFRRMKQTLDRMFTGAEWLSEGKTEFTGTVSAEQVRFEDSVILAGGELPAELIQLPKNHALHERVAFLTDGFGTASAFEQIRKLLGEELAIQISMTAVEDPAAPEANGSPAGP